MVVNQANDLVVLLDAINGYGRFAGGGLGFQNRDVVDGFPIPVVHRERLPIRRKAWYKPQFIHFEPQPEEGFYDQPVHPSSRACVPRPSTAACICRLQSPLQLRHGSPG